MNTPAHLIFGAAAFGRPGRRAVTFAALLGGFLPDLSLYAMAGVSLYVLGIPAKRVFDELYFSSAWQQVFAIDNSFWLWGIVLAFALWRKTAWLVGLTASAILHLAFDFMLHNQDARVHFWPLSDWRFRSPISYWEPAYFGAIVSKIELAAVAALTLFLLYRHKDVLLRATFCAVAIAELAPAILFRGHHF